VSSMMHILLRGTEYCIFIQYIVQVMLHRRRSGSAAGRRRVGGFSAPSASQRLGMPMLVELEHFDVD